MSSFYFDWENSGRLAIIFTHDDKEMFTIQGYHDVGDSDEFLPTGPSWQPGVVMPLEEAVKNGFFSSLDEAREYPICNFLSLKSAEEFVQ